MVLRRAWTATRPRRDTIHPRTAASNLEMRFEVGGVQYVAFGATPVSEIRPVITTLMLMRTYLVQTK